MLLLLLRVFRLYSGSCKFVRLIDKFLNPIGAVPYVVVPELWAQGPRPAGMSIAIQTLWICNFITGITFPYLQVCISFIKNDSC